VRMEVIIIIGRGINSSVDEERPGASFRKP
jgi:hypothetical protein